MRAVYSFWDGGNGLNAKTGFNTFGDFLMCTALSVCVSRKHFNDVSLVTNSFGEDMFVRAGIPITSSSRDFDGIEKWLSPYFWGYTKMLAYARQRSPFVHIDNDVMLWSGIPESVSSKPIFFQSIEPFVEQPEYYGWYDHLVELCENKAPFYPDFIRKNKPVVAYNCGIAGANDLEIISRWFELSTSYVRNGRNIREFFSDPENLMIHQNLLHEQYFIASLLKGMGYHPINGRVGILCEDLNDLCGDKVKYTHLWGLVKRDKDIMRKVGLRLLSDFPDVHDKVTRFIHDNDLDRRANS